MAKITDNSGESAKAKPRGKPFPKGKSGNPAGAPKRGQSWAELFNQIGELTGGQAAERALKLWVKQFKQMPEGVTLKELVVIRAYAALLDESNARLLKEVMDRAEGKVADVVKGTGDSGKIEIEVTYVKPTEK